MTRLNIKNRLPFSHHFPITTVVSLSRTPGAVQSTCMRDPVPREIIRSNTSVIDPHSEAPTEPRGNNETRPISRHNHTHHNNFHFIHTTFQARNQQGPQVSTIANGPNRDFRYSRNQRQNIRRLRSFHYPSINPTPATVLHLLGEVHFCHAESVSSRSTF